MLKIGQNWGKIANYPPQCSTKIGTTVKQPFKSCSALLLCAVLIRNNFNQNRPEIVFCFLQKTSQKSLNTGDKGPNPIDPKPIAGALPLSPQ